MGFSTSNRMIQFDPPEAMSSRKPLAAAHSLENAMSIGNPLLGAAVVCLGLLLAAEPTKDRELVFTDAAGKERKITKWKFADGTSELSWLVPPAAEPKKNNPAKGKPQLPVGPEALRFRQEKSTGFADGILTLIPLDRLKSLEYDHEQQIVTAKVATADPAKDEVLTGTTRYRGINKLTIQVEVDKGDMGIAELRYQGGVPKNGIRGLRFSTAQAPAADKGRPARVTDTDKKEKTVHSVVDLQALYRVPGGRTRLLPLLMFKKTLKVDLGKVKKLTPGNGGTLKSPEWMVAFEDGEKQTLRLLLTIPLDDREAVLEGLLGRVPAGYQLFPIHTISAVEFD